MLVQAILGMSTAFGDQLSLLADSDFEKALATIGSTRGRAQLAIAAFQKSPKNAWDTSSGGDHVTGVPAEARTTCIRPVTWVSERSGFIATVTERSSQPPKLDQVTTMMQASLDRSPLPTARPASAGADQNGQTDCLRDAFIGVPYRDFLSPWCRCSADSGPGRKPVFRSRLHTRRGW